MAKRSYWRRAGDWIGLAAAVAMVLFVTLVRHPVASDGVDVASSSDLGGGPTAVIPAGQVASVDTTGSLSP